MGEVLDLLKAENYRLHSCQVIAYDPKRPDVFPPPFLTYLYNQMKASGRRGKLGSLQSTFCGMVNLEHDAITAYLAAQKLTLLIVWTSPTVFKVAGFAFPSVSIGVGDQKAMFLAYTFFKEWWGRPEILTLTILGLGYFFFERSLLAIHGSRYASNDRSARLIRQVGFRDVGQVPRYMLNEQGKLTDMIVSSLLVEEFEEKALPLLERIASDGEGEQRTGAVVRRQSGPPQ